MPTTSGMMRAGISGTNWTGKTTTLVNYAARHADRATEIVSLSDLVKSCPHPMIEHQTPDGSRWMFEHVARRLERHAAAKLQLFDRTPLDILAFTRYGFDREGKPVDQALMARIAKLFQHFSLIFYAAPSDEWPADVSPSPKELGFALLMDWYIRRVAAEYSVETVTLPWDLDDRYPVLEQYLQG